MRKKIKKQLTGLLVIAGVVTSTVSVNAQTVTKEKRGASSYTVTTMSTSYATTRQKRLDAPGFRKTKYTSGSITVTQSRSYSFSTSSSVDAKYKTLFGEVGGSVGVTASKTKSIAAGTTLNVMESAPSGIYYGYICMPQKKVKFKVQTCSLNHTGWYTRYEKTFTYAPRKSGEYITVKKV